MAVPSFYFQYSPLNCSTNEIRLVRLHQAAGSTWCELRHFPIEACPPYLALSYTWGDRTDTIRIRVNNGSLSVTKNLVVFLHHATIRQRIRGYMWGDPKWRVDGKVVVPPTLQEWLWIDALCIDQSNVPERNAQVPKMNSIYRKAQAVIMWLGPEADDSDIAMRAVKYLCRVGVEDSQRMQITTLMPFSSAILGPVDTPFDSRTWRAIKK